MLRLRDPISNLAGLSVAALIILQLSGCVSTEEVGTGTASATIAPTTGGTVVTVPTASITGGIYMKFEYSWENEESYTTLGTCKVAAGAATGTTANCTMTLPEGQMYFSKFRMTAGTSDAATCPIVIVQPFYYRASTSAAYVPNYIPGASSTDCATAPIKSDCFNGAAVDLVPSFPTYTSLVYLTDDYLELSGIIDSGHDRSRGTNRWMSNNLSNKNAVISDYVAGSMQDWYAACKDKWFDDIYRVTVKVTDQDTSTGGGEDPGGALDHFSDWEGN